MAPTNPPFDSRSLAKFCGVSRGTVDRALHGRGEVNAKTREKILKMAEKHGYQPNAVGQALVTGRTRTLGLVAFDLENSFFTEIISAAEKRAREKGYTLLIAFSQKSPDLERECIDFLAQKKVDGLALIPVTRGGAFSTRLTGIGFPVVSFGNRVSPKIPFVGIDEKKAMEEAVEFAFSHGYRSIQYYCPPMRHRGPVNLGAQELRLAGYRSAMKRLDLGARAIEDTASIGDFFRAARKEPGKASLLCSNDLYALEVLEAAARENLRPPEDFGLMGFDGLAFLKYVRPAMSTVRYPTHEAGSAMVDLLLRLIDGGHPIDQILRHEILGRRTMEMPASV